MNKNVLNNKFTNLVYLIENGSTEFQKQIDNIVEDINNEKSESLNIISL
jgi:hypothetical protein